MIALQCPCVWPRSLDVQYQVRAWLFAAIFRCYTKL